jgi:hypothetical protein
MNLLESIIQKLNLHFAWSKRTGDAANQSKINNNSGNIAGRDINIYASPQKDEKPYACIDGIFGGNGVRFSFRGRIENLSDQPIFPETIEMLGQRLDFSENRHVAANGTFPIARIEYTPYSNRNDDEYLDFTFRTRGNVRFRVRQQLRFQSRADEKFNVVGLSGPVIEQL